MMICLAALPVEEDIPKFNQFYQEYKGLMGKIAFEHIHDSDLSEDCVHECMLYFAEHFDKIEEVRSKKTLGMVIRLTKERAINFYNKQMRINLNETSVSEDEELSSESVDPALEYNAKELSEAISELPEKYCKVLVMRAHYGFSYTEISEILGITEATARKRFERAKAMLMSEQNLTKEGSDL